MKKKNTKKKLPKEEEHVIFIDRLTDFHIQKDQNNLQNKKKKCKQKH